MSDVSLTDRHVRRPDQAPPGVRLTGLVLVPAVAMVVVGGAVTYLLAADRLPTLKTTVLVTAAVLAILILLVAGLWARWVARVVDEQLADRAADLEAGYLAGPRADYRTEQQAGHRAGHRLDDRTELLPQQFPEAVRVWPERFSAEITRFTETLRGGDWPVLREPVTSQVDERDPMAVLTYQLEQAHRAAELAVLAAVELTPREEDPIQRLHVFANLGRRQQSLVHRAIRMLDGLENQVEDPDLLKGLFDVDHLVTRMRRQAENLVVLGGAQAPRQWSTPWGMVAVLRSSVAEVEQYRRVKMVLPIEGNLRGHAATEVIHLLAELIENATVFSDPDSTQVMLRARKVTSGLAIEVEDRGLGMPAEQLDRINELFVGPDKIDIGELLANGLIGLWVVAKLARRNDVKVRLQTNIFGGVTADVVLPHSLLVEDQPEAPADQQAAPASGGVVAAPEPGRRRARHAEADDYSPAPAVTVPPAVTAQPAPAPPQPAPEPALPISGYFSAEGFSGDSVEAGQPDFGTPESTIWPLAPVEVAQEEPGYGRHWPDLTPDRTTDLKPDRTPDPAPDLALETPPAPISDSINQQRPRLPKRDPGISHLAPELLQPTPVAETPIEHTPDLMANFRDGFSAGDGAEFDDQGFTDLGYGDTGDPVGQLTERFQGESSHYE